MEQALLIDQHARPHPRMQMQRDRWELLNGEWEFSDGRGTPTHRPDEVRWDRRILVPFSPETAKSGIGDTGFYSTVWYRRTWEQPPLAEGEHLWLHFEAVDWRATVWVNGHEVAVHEGGYTPFGADITGALVPGETQEVVVRSEDDPADLAKPRGKQDWRLEPHSIWYPRTTGIWQAVWLETVPEIRLQSLRWTSNLKRWEVGLEALLVDGTSSAKAPLQLYVRLAVGEYVLAEDTYRVVAGEVHRRIALSDPGVDDYRNEFLWSPASPTLIDAEIELRDPEGRVLDTIHSYTALRSVATQGDRFLLNNRPLNLRLVLDQGYWPESGLTAPDEAALIKDIELVKALGFNGVRKHQKIECTRFLYWADKMGLLVWEEMPSAYRYTTKSINRLTREWLEVLHRDQSHPCIIAWVPFNESWGVPDLPDSPAQRHYVQALYHLTKALDPSRPVIGNDGWESVATDILGIHDYDDTPERIGARYRIHDVEAKLFQRERPGGRVLNLGREAAPGCQPMILTEFGGIALSTDAEETWGYSRSDSAAEFLERYRALLETVRKLPALAGFCYTQFTDTFQEANGLLYADRTPKAPIESLAEATSGLVPDQGRHMEALWKEQLMQA